ncbi:small GTP-binding protein [Histomonas meleagridis]|uniref:small GTP-binding protein n=1 Tax=Histomonas meleagridis TaxID=135588 RepID=UPI00355A8FC8|nr:small GTP-binding protein [Histomonas meleagridis]KAH0796349.1 small GTP-binding protein [Histomonas meleagridis]
MLRTTRRMESNRVILIGNPSVGKTALINCLLKQESTDNYEPTIGAAFYNYTKKIKGEEFSIQIWDTAGQEQYRSLGPIYYRNARAAIFVYDVNSVSTFEGIPTWLEAFKNSVGRSSVLYLVGNKVDLVQGSSKVDEATALKYAEENDFTFFQTSALTGLNVDRLFQNVMHRLASEPSVQISSKLEVNKDGKKCC